MTVTNEDDPCGVPFRRSPSGADSAAQPVDVVRVDPQSAVAARDVAAAEEPLEIRLGGRPFVVIMRTPGQDRQLAAGFLLSEQIVRTRRRHRRHALLHRR